ncbi:piRNA biogenesis protein EXD1-like [Coccinella septempunctata]|uniref:piRNA biogenesis protein EXD1-like n=1 Tax=Coccinella septempunctata TaxID=41139 RepID=UPI001D066EEE|nr:piRNA biogenesis protein EXD1-like [Coccinella septempunctata]
MEKKFEQGERILIVLNSGENFEGDYVKGSDTRIEIENFLHYESGNKFDSKWTFYKGEISSVLRIGKKKPDTVETPVDNSDNKILIPREEYERLIKMTDDYIVIKTDDKTYFDSVEKLANYESLGVIASNCERGRNGRIKMLALSTWKQIYIFDFHNFRSKQFPKELADILQSHYIQKVVFNGGPFIDCMLHAYKIPVNHVFDVQISHLLLVKNSTGKCEEELPTIGQCLTKYFNFSSSFMTSCMEILNDSWEVRPVDVDKLKKISRLVTYLIILKDHQMALMLKDYNKAVQGYHDLFTKSTNYHLMEMTSNRKCTKQIDTLIPNSLLEFNSLKSIKYQ